jgi:hypothetical protein
MAKINVSSTVAQLQKQFDKLKSQKTVALADLPEGKLKDLAYSVAPRVKVPTGGGCYESQAGDKVSVAKLKTAVAKVAKDLKAADRDGDNFLTQDEAKKLSRASKDLLDLNPDGSQIVSASCYA